MTNLIETRPINDLLEEKFFIPKYQRGYRWGEKQVIDLLADISEFSQNHEKVEFYCLQPVVVKRREQDWEVIDGQQRLTTIYIILNFFNNRFSEEFRKELYDLRYETRPKSAHFLKELNDKVNFENIDFHFISLAYRVVKGWFKSRMNIINDFESTLLNRVKVIWYEVQDDEDKAVAIFTRINIGKIPLTNAELIKALFLRSKNFAGQQLEQVRLQQLKISNEWDTIETKLQDDSFWYFLYGEDGYYATRIELLFDLITQKKKTDDDFFTFFEYSKKELNKNPETLYEAWSEVKNTYLRLWEWFEDKEFYHLIGFLVHTGTKLEGLLEKAQGLTKSNFKRFLTKLISSKIPKDITEVTYSKAREVRNILLLFNVQTILNSPHSNIRFAFDAFKKENWDIEHIRSQNSEIPRANKRERWLKDILEYINSPYSVSKGIQKQMKALKAKIGSLLEHQNLDSDEFEQLYDEILKLFKEDDQDDFVQGLGNLALLDSRTNRGYKNVIFPLKRKTIIENDKRGKFVPIGTKNAFLKYYTKNPNELIFWQKQDAKDYLKQIEETLRPYLKTAAVL